MKRDEANYREWSITIGMLFDAFDMLGYIGGTFRPSIDFNVKLLAILDVINWRAHGNISQSVTINVCAEMHGMRIA